MYALPIIKSYPNADFRTPFDPGSVLPGNLREIQARQQLLGSPLSDQVKAEFASIMIMGTDKQKNEIASARIQRINLNILEDLIGMDFFEVINLAHNEIPQLVLQRDQKWRASQIGMHGGAPYDSFQNLDTLSQFVPYALESDVATYPLMSPIIGRFDEVAGRVNNRVAHDWNRKMDMDLFTLMDASYQANFDDPSTVYELDPRIQNFPTGNLLDTSSDPGINLDLFKAIFQHFGNMGTNGPKVRSIWVPSTELSNMWSMGSFVSGYAGGSIQPGQEITQELRTQLLTRGALWTMFGNTFQLRISNVLEPNYIRVSTDRPFGTLFMKPEFDRVKRYSEDELEARNGIKNHEGIRICKFVVPVIPSPWKLNSLKVKIH